MEASLGFQNKFDFGWEDTYKYSILLLYTSISQAFYEFGAGKMHFSIPLFQVSFPQQS